MYGKIDKIHFVGIGGIGMSGIAEVLSQPGLQGLRFRPARVRHHRPSGCLGALKSASATSRKPEEVDVVS